MRVFVAGGTGAVGRHTIPAWVQQGHTVTALARTPEKAAALTAQGATTVLVSLAADVGRLVQESVSMLYRDQGAGWVDEEALIDRYPMARGNLAAEADAHRFSAAGGTEIVVRFGWFYGPGATHSEQLLALARRHFGLVLGPADSYVSSPGSLHDSTPTTVAGARTDGR